MTSIVLVHGACQGGWIWGPAASTLRKLGHDVFAPTLDGCAERKHQLRPGISNDSHASEVAAMLHYEDLHDVTLVGTSTGGMAICRVAELARARIGRLVFADALALFDGERLSDFVTRRNPVTTETGTGPTHEDARDRLFADLAPQTREWALERTTLHPRGVMEEPVALKSFWDDRWTASVIWCRNSVNPPREHQQRGAERLGAAWLEMDCGHYPMLEDPEALAQRIVEGA